MPRAYRHLQMHFAGGEMSPEMWSRYDDVRVRSGAERLLNKLTHPRGSAARRPGFSLVQKTKETVNPVRLLDFQFSRDQTLVIEMGRATIDSREIGYFRFHSEGGTLLQPRPPDYRTTETITDVNLGTERFTVTGIPADHEFQTGDPIVFTMGGTTQVCSFAASDTITATGHAFMDGDVVNFNTTGSLPPEVEEHKIYYVVGASAGTTFKIATKLGGTPITFSVASSPTCFVACLPRPQLGGSPYSVLPNTVYYAVRNSSTEFQVAATYADAVAATPVVFDWDHKGTFDKDDIKIHYDYDAGDVAVYDGFGVENPFYCRKRPWGTPGSLFCYPKDHVGHDPSNLIYWMRQPGRTDTVTFTLGTPGKVNWSGHPLQNGDPVTFTSTGTLPTGILAGQVYYVRNEDTGGFELSESLPGPVIPLSGSPSGTHTAFGNGFYEVPHFYTSDILFEVNFVQSMDVLTLVHQDKPIAELKRLGATKWLLEDVEFNSVDAPIVVSSSAIRGPGHFVDQVDTSPTPAEIRFSNSHDLQPEELVYLEPPVGDIAEGFYRVRSIPDPGSPPSLNKKITLKTIESGQTVDSGTATTNGRIRASDPAVDIDETYVVTALYKSGEESRASSEVKISNNLTVLGARNRISWSAVVGADRYRVYKDLNGLFGYIGEVDAPTTQFDDENIGPDLSITPPILDDALRRSALVTFDQTATRNVVLWVGHGLEVGEPVVFDTNGALPTNIKVGETYYVINDQNLPDEFQLGATPEATTPIDLTTGVVSGRHFAITGRFPAAVTYFEQRRFFGGPRVRPQDFWLTASGTESDNSYSIPTVDSDRIQNRLTARKRSQILHGVPVGHLVLLTNAAEFRLTPLDSDALTPGSVAARAPTHVGCSTVAPVLVNNTVLFPSARGGHLREMGFLDTVGDYVTGDVSLRAAHLFEEREIVQLDYQQAPHPIIWVVNNAGTLLGFTYVPEEQVAGWHEHTINGTIESCAVVSEGDEDRLYIVANRNGTRYVERMGLQCIDAIEDVSFVDSGVTYDDVTTPVTSVFVPHLAGQTVTFLADGIKGTGVVSAGGDLTLPSASTKVHVGLPYTSRLRTLPIGLQLDAAAGSGRTKNINAVWLRVRKSGQFKVGPDSGSLSLSEAVTPGQLQTKLVEVVTDGNWDLEGQITVETDDPLPLIITGLTLEVASGG